MSDGKDVLVPTPPRIMVHSRHRADDDRDRAGRALIEVTLDGVVHRFRTEGGGPPLMISVTDMIPRDAFHQLWYEYGEASDRDYKACRRTLERGDAVQVDAEFHRVATGGLVVVEVSPHFYVSVDPKTVNPI